MIHSVLRLTSRPIRRPLASRLAVVVMALTVFAFMLGLNVARLTTQYAPTSACVTSPAVVYMAIGPARYTDDEAAVRLNARAGYAVRRVHYAPSVHGLARGRHVARW